MKFKLCLIFLVLLVGLLNGIRATCTCEQVNCHNLDFKKPLCGWTRTGAAFNNQPTYGDNPTARKRGQPANQQGDWWIGSYEDRPSPDAPAGEVQGDGPKGTLTSPPFLIIGNQISFLIGGGCNLNEVRVDLIVNDVVVKTATGNCHETMERKSWDVAAFIGGKAQVSLIDNSSAGWGHINFDDLKGNIFCL